MRTTILIFALWAAGLGAAAQFGKVSVAWGPLAALYPGLGAFWLGVMVSVVGMVGLAFGTTAGMAVSRLGARRTIVGALLLGAAVSALQGFAPPAGVMILSRVLEGISHLAIVVVGPVAIAQAAPPARQGAAMTLWSSFFGLTYAVLAWIGPEILSAGGVPLLFRLHAVWMLALALVLLGLMPREAAPAAASTRRGVLAEHAAVYASPFIAAPALGFVCYTMTYVAVLTLLPPALTMGGFVGVAMPLVSIGLSLTLGVWLLSRMPAWRLVQGGFAVAILASLFLWASIGQPLAEVAAALALGGALGIVQGASFASIPQLNPAPADRARAAGAIAQLGNLGTTSGTPILVLLMDRAGMAGLALFVAGFALLGIAVNAAQARRRRALSG